jgi:methionine-rich copper-binding protein CopC
MTEDGGSMIRNRGAKRQGWLVPFSAFVFCACLATSPPTFAMTVLEQVPTVNQIMDGGALAFALRFDRPIDHGLSSFTLVTPGGSRTLRVRLDAEPNTLYGTIGRLPPGSYQLQWHALAVDRESLAGTIPFKVGP